MALTQIQTTSIASAALESFSTPRIANVQIADASWNVKDDTALGPSGGYLIINGTAFPEGSLVTISNATVAETAATAVSRYSSSQLRVTVQSLAVGTYNIRIAAPNGSIAFLVNAFVVSAAPTWVNSSTLPPQVVDVAVSVQLQALNTTTYALQAGSTLPTGLSLAANGLITGTVTGIGSTTTYNFTIEAIDGENQETPKQMSLTVGITPQPRYELWMWGAGQSGATGLGMTNPSRSSPVQVGIDTDWSLVAVNGYTAVATKTDGTLWGWGQNDRGQLGLRDTIARSYPTQISVSTDWYRLATGSSYTIIATKTNGTLWGWGGNNSGQLGLGDHVYRSSPTQIGNDTNWTSIAMGRTTTAAVKSNGTLWTWGSGFSGLLGQNTNYVTSSSPVQVGADTNWSVVSGTGYRMFAVKTNNTLWSWGNNNGGQLGHNNTTNYSSPTQVGTDTNWTGKIYQNYPYQTGPFVLAVKNNGTLWSWGVNSGQGGSGVLGLNDTISRSSPTQIGTDTNWVSAAAGLHRANAVKTNGTLWGWGGSVLNLGTPVTLTWGTPGMYDIIYSSPVQVGSETSWGAITSNMAVAFAIKQYNT